MKRTVHSFVAAIGFLLLLSLAASAQSSKTDFNIDKFRELATRAESVVASGQAANDALEILRANLVSFRSQALKAQNSHARRVTTVEEQIAALGAAPEGDSQEIEAVAQRRSELSAQLSRARAPLLVAQEAFGQASGLIVEIDKIIRARNKDALLQVNKTPLNPVLWAQAASALTKHIRQIGAEVETEWTSNLSSKLRRQNGPVLLLLIVIGLILMFPVTNWSAHFLACESKRRPTQWSNFKYILASLSVFTMPFIGLILIFSAVYIADIFALRGDMLLSEIPSAGLAIFGAYWLTKNLPYRKPIDEDNANDIALLIPPSQKLIWYMGLIIAFRFILGGLENGADWSADIVSTIMFPAIVLLGYCLLRCGRLIRKFQNFLHVEEDVISIPERIASLYMWACNISGIGGPVLAVFGYSNAGEILVFSMSLTLALSATVYFLNHMLIRFVSLPVDETSDRIIQQRPTGGLYKIAITFVLICLSIPLFALIWGARMSDISGVWFTLNEGVALGDTRISISDFLIFILIFFIGYTVTRLLQTTLRTIVFPNTTIESGAQNALVTGFGYIGIFLAALIAITTTGLDLSSLAIVAGALSVGIGFGLQAIVSNFVSGIILLIERPVKIGDWVEIGAYSGSVRKVSVRSTSVETFDGATVIIPNADLVAGTVTNWTHNNVRGRVKVPVGVAYGTDTELVKDILLAIADNHPMVLKHPKPQVVFMGFGADSMDFQLRGILRDVNYVLGTASDMNFEIVKRFKENNIEIPFAQREVTIKNPQDFLPKTVKPARKPRAKPKA